MVDRETSLSPVTVEPEMALDRHVFGELMVNCEAHRKTPRSTMMGSRTVNHGHILRILNFGDLRHTPLLNHDIW